MSAGPARTGGEATRLRLVGVGWLALLALLVLLSVCLLYTSDAADEL